MSNFAKKRIMSKGRNKKLISMRDEAICRRYYYWTEVKRLRFDDTLKILSEQEFFLSEERILSIIRNARKDRTSVHRVRMPRLTYEQLSLFTDEAGYPVSQIHHENKT
jgi:Lhr-like helicase